MRRAVIGVVAAAVAAAPAATAKPDAVAVHHFRLAAAVLVQEGVGYGAAAEGDVRGTWETARLWQARALVRYDGRTLRLVGPAAVSEISVYRDLRTAGGTPVCATGPTIAEWRSGVEPRPNGFGKYHLRTVALRLLARQIVVDPLGADGLEYGCHTDSHGAAANGLDTRRPVAMPRPPAAKIRGRTTTFLYSCLRSYRETRAGRQEEGAVFREVRLTRVAPRAVAAARRQVAALGGTEAAVYRFSETAARVCPQR